MPLPGLKPEEININLQGNRLTFSSEQKEERDQTDKDYLDREFSYGVFCGPLRSPMASKARNVRAEIFMWFRGLQALD